MRQPSPGEIDSAAIYRAATPGDLPAAAAIHAAGDAEMVRRMHPLAGIAGFSEAARSEAALAGLGALYDENPHQVWIAEYLGRVVGVTSAAFRGRHAHVQSLFVTPGLQERGIGRELLQALHDAATRAGCSVFTLQASDDPRALTRYLQLGFRPQPPNIVWSATNPRFPASGLDNLLEQIPVSSDDIAELNTIGDIDKAVRGTHRVNDLRRWLDQGECGTLLVDRATGKPSGYFLVSRVATRGRIGPVATIDRSRFEAVLALALAAASTLNGPEVIWRIATPGDNHSAVAPLLAARFRPAFTMPFFATAPIGQFDRYAFHDLDLL